MVVMDKEQYRKKACSLMNDENIYTVLKSELTGMTKRELNKRLLLLKKSNKISQIAYKILCSSERLSPRNYG